MFSVYYFQGLCEHPFSLKHLLSNVIIVFMRYYLNLFKNKDKKQAKY